MDNETTNDISDGGGRNRWVRLVWTQRATAKVNMKH